MTRAFLRALVTKRNRSSYVQVTIYHVKVWDFAPFRSSYVREFELSHSKLVNRIIKITHAHNLHVKMLVFRPRVQNAQQRHPSAVAVSHE